MGGIGSGRRYQDGKGTTNDYRALDVRRLQREGQLTPGQSFSWNWMRNGESVASIQLQVASDKLTLIYRHKRGGNYWQPMEYSVWLDWTSCTLGGRRTWFLCPAKECRRRVALLYIGRAGMFACRHCYRLAYACQRESADGRAARRTDAVRRRLGWDVGILNPTGDKPKGMHWRTFERLTAEHDALLAVALAGMGQRLGLLERSLLDL